MSEIREPHTKYYPKQWYRIDYVFDDGSHCNFTAYKIKALDEANPENSDCEKESDFSGFLKWDGCMEINGISIIHFCHKEHIQQYNEIIQEIYDYGEENHFTN